MSTFLTYCSLLVLVPILAIVILVVIQKKRRQQKVLAGFKAVLITGCDRGFGFMLAKRLDSEGFKVFAGCLNANGDGAKSLESQTSSKLEILQLDVTNEDQIEAARTDVASTLMGHMLWAVVNNAGIASHADFEWHPKANFKKLIDVNFMGVVNVTRAFLPLLRASKGRVINMASMAGRTALPGFTAYSASKFAVIGFSDSLRREMSHFGVKVILMEPALYKTEIATTVISQNEMFWSVAEPGIKRDYGETFFQDTQLSRTNLLRWASDEVNEVVDCYVDAITSAHPLNRYVPPLSMRLLNDLMNTMLNSIQDAIIGGIMGVKHKPEMLSPHIVENCRMGRRRSHAT